MQPLFALQIFLLYQQLHRYRLEAAQAEEEKKTIAELTFETMYRL